MINKEKVRCSISFAKNWILNSGIRNINESSKYYGGFNAWYDTTNKKFSFVYSEITGYGINILLFLNKIKPNNIFINRARKAADWLINTAFEPSVGGILCRFDYDSNKFTKKVCTFDNGICLNSLVNLYRITNDRKYLDFSLKIAETQRKCRKIRNIKETKSCKE